MNPLNWGKVGSFIVSTIFDHHEAICPRLHVSGEFGFGVRCNLMTSNGLMRVYEEQSAPVQICAVA
jgi:hypothetical protein